MMNTKWKAQDVLTDAFPQQEERHGRALIFGLHERAPQLKRRAEPLKQSVVVIEKGSRV
jgi:hypothetical protein